MAMVSLGSREDALDVVQEAMLQLVKHYSDKSTDELRPLFYRILHNKINDTHRRNNVRNRFKGWLPVFRDKEGDYEEEDPFQNVPAPKQSSPEQENEQIQEIARIERALQLLPFRQQQAFMLRCWEGLSTRDAALSMRCSEGTVKTHYSRALQSLRLQLEGDG